MAKKEGPRRRRPADLRRRIANDKAAIVEHEHELNELEDRARGRRLKLLAMLILEDAAADRGAARAVVEAVVRKRVPRLRGYDREVFDFDEWDWAPAWLSERLRAVDADAAADAGDDGPAADASGASSSAGDGDAVAAGAGADRSVPGNGADASAASSVPAQGAAVMRRSGGTTPSGALGTRRPRGAPQDADTFRREALTGSSDG